MTNMRSPYPLGAVVQVGHGLELIDGCERIKASIMKVLYLGIRIVVYRLAVWPSRDTLTIDPNDH